MNNDEWMKKWEKRIPNAEGMRKLAFKLTDGITTGHDWPNTQEELDLLSAGRCLFALSEALAHLHARPLPVGWKLVPIEPTQEILRAMVEAREGPAVYKVMSDGGLRSLEHDARFEYAAALAASPEKESALPVGEASPADGDCDAGERCSCACHVRTDMRASCAYWRPAGSGEVDKTDGGSTAGVAVPPAPADPIMDVVEKIAQQWDGCFYEDAIGGDIDIGEAIRDAGIKLTLGVTEAPAPATVREFTNELGNRIRITIEGPTSTAENVLTPMEARELRQALADHDLRTTPVADQKLANLSDNAFGVSRLDEQVSRPSPTDGSEKEADRG